MMASRRGSSGEDTSYVTEFGALTERNARLHAWLGRIAPLTQSEQPAPSMLDRLLLGEPTLADRIRKGIDAEGATGKSPGQAIDTLGYETVREVSLLAVTSCVLFELSVRGGIRPKGLQQLAAAVGAITRALVRRSNPGEADVAFVAGLIANVGISGMACLHGETYRSLLQSLAGSPLSLVEAERKSFGRTHAEGSAGLLWSYGLPPIVLSACLKHHEPDQAGIVGAVGIAETIASQLGFDGGFALMAPNFDPAVLAPFGLSEAHLGLIADEATKLAAKMDAIGS